MGRDTTLTLSTGNPLLGLLYILMRIAPFAETYVSVRTTSVSTRRASVQPETDNF